MHERGWHAKRMTMGTFQVTAHNELACEPKPPPKRITLTFPVLNTMTRHVIFCGAGESKSAILKDVFLSLTLDKEEHNASCYRAQLVVPAPYPCAMVLPNTSASDEFDNTLTWVVDVDAMKDVLIHK